MSNFLVSSFELATLSNMVKESFGESFPDIFKKDQIKYISQYLKELGAKSVLLECDYVDKDFVEDYSRFYVKKFNNLGSKCSRLHFFSEEVNHATIHEKIFSGNLKEASDYFNNLYLGFVVIKPLSKNFIGRTCLKTKISSHEEVKKRVLSRPYKVNLFGVELCVNSIAFQEQDKVVSACATTAIWSCLNALDWMQVRDIPSCSEITLNAINYIEKSNNGFPSKELSNKQILRALDVSGLRHRIERVKDIDPQRLLKVVQSYIDSGLPLIIGGVVYKKNPKGSYEELAGHAISLLGYKVKADEIAFYVHDDRVGPFAKAIVKEWNSADPSQSGWALSLQRKDVYGKWIDSNEVIVPDNLIFVSDKKARIPLLNVLRTCERISEIFEDMGKVLAKDGGVSEKFSFDLRLMDISSIKREILSFKKNNLNNIADSVNNIINEFAVSSYARFQWVARFYLGENLGFYVLVDSTEVPQGDAVSIVVPLSEIAEETILVLKERLKYLFDEEEGKPDPNDFLESFYRRLIYKKDSIYSYLDEKYGELRAPAYLKAEEFPDGKIRVNENVVRIFDHSDLTLDQLIKKIKRPNDDSGFIWAISHDGALLIGHEFKNVGHPCITGFKSARIAGEIKKVNRKWVINSRSGRYSKDYSNADVYLNNALMKFRKVFSLTTGKISIEKN